MRACVIIWTLASVANACPFCKESFSSGLARGFYWSIFLMLGVPLVVVAVIAGIVIKASRKS